MKNFIINVNLSLYTVYNASKTYSNKTMLCLHTFVI